MDRPTLSDFAILVLLALHLANPHFATARTIFVDCNAVGENTGSSWKEAHLSLQDALSAAETGDEIRVAKGIYRPDEHAAAGGRFGYYVVRSGDRAATFQLKNGVSLQGGYAGSRGPDPNDRDVELYRTVLSGDLKGNDVQIPDPCNLLTAPSRADNSYHVLTGTGTDATAVLDGFTITAGNAGNVYGSYPYDYDNAGGMYISGSGNGSGPTITNCTFTANSGMSGGAIYSFGRLGSQSGYGPGPTFANCDFIHNGGRSGGALFNWRSTVTLTGCTFSGNWASRDGGALGHSIGELTLTNCKFTNNTARSGGGIDNGASNARLTACTFTGNSAQRRGGAISNSYDGTATFTDCTFTENSAAEDGGGMCNGGISDQLWCLPTLSNCTFSGNSAERYGGGMYNTFAKASLTDCTFSDNSAYNGGAIHNRANSVPVLTGCSFAANLAQEDGGALCNDYSHPELTDCVFRENAANDGGAIYNDRTRSILSNCTFSRNLANRDGGAVVNNYGSPTLTNCTFAENQARDGGAVHNDSRCEVTLANCVFVDNSATTGGGLWNRGSSAALSNCTILGNIAEEHAGGLHSSGSTVTMINCILWGNSSGQISGGATVSYSDVEGGWAGEGNIDTDPCFANPDTEDCHLSAFSACIDAGDPVYSPAADGTDIDGGPRIVGGRIDIGADEYNPADSVIGISPTSFSLTRAAGAPDPEPLILSIRSRGSAPLNWAVMPLCNWVQVIPGTGCSTSEVDLVTIEAHISDLPAGNYGCSLLACDPNAANSPQAFSVSLTIHKPYIDLSAEQLTFSVTTAAPQAHEEMLTIHTSGGRALPWTIAYDCDWLQVRPRQGTLTDVNDIALSADVSNLDLGFHSTELTFTAPDIEEPERTIQVTVHVVAEQIDVPDQFPTIQAAIEHVAEGGTVIIAPGTYTGDGNRDIDFKGKAFTLCSIDPTDPNIVAATIIDCNSTYQDPHLGLRFCSGEDANSVLRGFTITDAALGILCTQASSPTIDSCFVTGNAVHDDPWAHGDSGGIKCEDNSAPLITNCHITGNRAVDGGGLCCYFSNPTVRDCFFNRNVASGCPWCVRSIPGNGGGIFCSESNPLIENCVISNNRAGRGAGVFCGDSDPIIIGCVITGNMDPDPWADDGRVESGGGICCYASSPIIRNCTISDNIHVAGKGGGISSYVQSNPFVENCILWGNAANDGNEIALLTLEYYSGERVHSAASVSYSDIRGGAEAAHVEPGCQLHWGLGNMDTDPLFAKPGHWKSSGSGWSQTYTWFDGDYHLKSQGWRWDQQRRAWTWDDVTSLCIDAGNPGSPLGDELPAIADDPDGKWGKNVRINMGAYGGTAQAGLAPPGWSLLSDLTNDRATTFEDLAAWAETWLCADSISPGDLDRDGIVDFSDFGLLADDWLE